MYRVYLVLGDSNVKTQESVIEWLSRANYSDIVIEQSKLADTSTVLGEYCAENRIQYKCAPHWSKSRYQHRSVREWLNTYDANLLALMGKCHEITIMSKAS